MSDQQQVVACRIAGVEYAFPIGAVREIIRGVQTQPIGSSDPTALGIVDLRGTAMPVHDLALALGQGAQSSDADAETRGGQRIVVTSLGEGDGVVGWLVDGVDEVLVVDSNLIEDVDQTTSKLVRRIAHVGEGRLLPVLDVDFLLAGRVTTAAWVA